MKGKEFMMIVVAFVAGYMVSVVMEQMKQMCGGNIVEGAKNPNCNNGWLTTTSGPNINMRVRC